MFKTSVFRGATSGGDHIEEYRAKAGAGISKREVYFRPDKSNRYLDFTRYKHSEPVGPKDLKGLIWKGHGVSENWA